MNRLTHLICRPTSVLILSALLAWLAATRGTEASPVFYEQNFNSLSTGNLTGQDSWTTPGGETSWVVTSGVGIGGTNAARASSASSITIRDIRSISGIPTAGDHVILQARVKALQHSNVAVGFTKTASYSNDLLWLRIYNNNFGLGYTGYQMEFYRNGVNQSTQGSLITSPAPTNPILLETGFYTFNIDWLVGTNITFNMKDSSDSTVFSGTTPDTIPSGDRANWAALELYVTTDGLATGTADVDNLTVVPEPASLGLALLGGLAVLPRRRRTI